MGRRCWGSWRRATTGSAGDAKIYYTTDGSEPDESSTEYATPFTMGIGTTTLRAKCYRGEFEPSDTIVETFVVQPGPVAPIITLHPVGREVESGSTVTFTVAATGTPTPTIQWQFRGSDLAGETEPELVLHDVGDGHVGAYRAVAANVAGSAAGLTATLSLVPEAIEGLTAINDGPTLVGSPTTLEASVTEGTNVSYAWDFGDDTVGSGRVVSHTYASAGRYTATVTASNEFGSASAQTEVVVVARLYLPGILREE